MTNFRPSLLVAISPALIIGVFLTENFGDLSSDRFQKKLAAPYTSPLVNGA